MEYKVNIPDNLYKRLKEHLFPGDGKEAVAIALCGRHNYGDTEMLIFHKIFNIPYSECSNRKKDLVKWKTSLIIPLIKEASKKNLALVKIHSHPNGYESFSETDTISDIDLFESIYGWLDTDFIHASMIMKPDGEIFGRVILPKIEFKVIDKIMVVGDDIKIYLKNKNLLNQSFNQRTEQTFGLGTTTLLKKIRVGVLGCSGTGSPLIEQLVRLGVGEFSIIDPDVIEEKNINRIYNSTMNDAKDKRYKVDVLKESIEKIGIDTKVKVFNKNIFDDNEIINSLATCDFIFGCVDSVDGRHIINQISTFYSIPFIDLGVKLIADGQGGISQICGTIHYIKPGGSSLQTRGQYNSEELRAAGLYRNNPEQYEEEFKSGYIHGVNVDSPAVISINTLTASIAVNDFLARIHPYRYYPNSNFAETRFSLTDSYFQYEEEGKPDKYLNRFVGRGFMRPLLNMPELD